MNPQIEQLRRQFNGYNTAQKREFIEKLRQKLQGNKNPEYTKFLNECIQAYAAASKMPTQNTADNGYLFLCKQKDPPLVGLKRKVFISCF